MRKRKKKKLLISTFLSVLATVSSVSLLPTESYASNTAVPDLIQADNQGNSAYLRWGVEMPYDNILYNTSFENGQERPSLYGGGSGKIGNQSFATEDRHSGSYSLKLTDTRRGNTGNAYWYPSTYSDSSAHYYGGRSIPNNSNLSITFNVKAVGGTTHVVSAHNGSPWGKAGLPLRTTTGEEVYYAQQVNWNSPPNSFKVYTKSGNLSFTPGYPYHIVSSRDQNHNYGLLFYYWNSATQQFEMDETHKGIQPFASGSPIGRAYTALKEAFNAGERVLVNDWAGVAFGSATIPNDNQWHTLSFNAKAYHPNFDFYADGFDMRNTWSTDGILYIDDLKMGYATKVKIYRNGVNLGISEDQSYLSQFTDTEATDKTSPTTPSNVQAKYVGGQIELSWNSATDNGTDYTYNISSMDKNGVESSKSQTKTVNVLSGVQKYQIYKNGVLLKETTSTKISINPNDYQNLTIVAVDNAGNRSPQSVIGNDTQAPSITHTVSSSTLSKDTVTISLTVIDNVGIKRIKLPNGNYVNASTIQYVANKNQNYSFIAEDAVGNQQSYTVEIDNIYHQLILEGEPNEEDNTIELNWNNPFDIPTTYVLHRKNANGEWESIPSKSTVKVLNIYPDESGIPNTGLSEGQIDLDGNSVPNSGILKTWLLKEGIDDVIIDTVSLSSFNANPSKHIKETDGIWNYDTIFYGMWNLQPERLYPNDNAIEYIRTFIEDGGGFMTSHHTIGYKGLDRGVNKLSSELGVEIFSNQTYNACPTYSGRDASGNLYPTVSFELIENVRCDYSSYWPTGNKVQIAKKGLLTEYPFKVGEIGQSYTIPSQHGLNVFGKGEVWMQTVNPTGFVGMPFKEINISPKTGEVGTNNFYVHTYNNTAIINSGHSFPSISEAETRIIANTLYYLAQTTTETEWVDRMGMDTASPTEPTIRLTSDHNNGADFSFSSEDMGVASEFMLKARNSKYEVQSNVEKVELKTGLKGYSYVIDKSPNTIPDRTIETTSNDIQVPNNDEFYLHVVAVDNAGNISSVSHYHYVDNEMPTLELSVSYNEWTTESIVITAKATDKVSGMKRIKLPNGVWVNGANATYTATQNGTYTFVAEDYFGNQTNKSIIVSNIDKIVPTSPIISNNQDWVNTPSVSVSVQAGTDTLSGVNRVEYKLEGATRKGWTKYTGTFQVSNEGETKITARTVDNVGQFSNETTSYARIDRSVPHNIGITIKLKP
ncbi:hypothetical protein CVD28_24435 [Bacillus sp. M6-12]|uniref:OmpL47-type beta-barrel domain-containing protein n=1 Tax=Bacillus sp. M6-12 TaxID=2054166 RepID=UPI000C784937|nr:hypothetical protein [Bacillus sp. M6-12]PLS15031.1 hypothetical protein CVD28_24435 [Bacillus sp. M6-12]